MGIFHCFGTLFSNFTGEESQFLLQISFRLVDIVFQVCLSFSDTLNCDSFFRSHRSLLWEYLRGVWADERSTEWSMWLIHSKMDLSANGNKKDLESLSHNMQLLSKPVVKKPVEEVKLTS